MNIPNSNFPKYVRNLAQIQRAYDTDNLHKKQFANGLLADKTGWRSWTATLGHVFYKLIGKSEVKNNEKFKQLFDENAGFYTTDETAESFSATAIAAHELKPIDIKLAIIAYQTLHFPIPQNLNRQLSQAESAQIDKLPQAYQSLLNDSLLNDPHYKQVLPAKAAKLARKLQQGPQKLTEEEQRLFQNCLKVYPKVREVQRNRILNDPYFSNDDLWEIRSIADAMDMRSEKAHQTFKEKHGEVKIEESLPKLSKEQAVAVHNLAKNELPEFFTGNTLPEVGRIAARAEQIILCGKEGARELTYPGKPTRFGEPHFTKWIIQEQKKQPSAEAARNSLIGSFFKDNVGRRTPITFQGETYDLTKEEQAAPFAEALRNGFYQALLNNPEMAKALTEANKTFGEETAIDPHVSSHEFQRILSQSTNNEWRSVREAFAVKTSFTDEQLGQLSSQTGLSRTELEPLLRVQMLKLMVALNQSTQAAYSNDLIPKLLPVFGPYATPVKQSLWEISPDLNQVAFSTNIPIQSPEAGDILTAKCTMKIPALTPVSPDTPAPTIAYEPASVQQDLAVPLLLNAFSINMPK